MENPTSLLGPGRTLSSEEESYFLGDATRSAALSAFSKSSEAWSAMRECDTGKSPVDVCLGQIGLDLDGFASSAALACAESFLRLARQHRMPVAYITAGNAVQAQHKSEVEEEGREGHKNLQTLEHNRPVPEVLEKMRAHPDVLHTQPGEARFWYSLRDADRTVWPGVGWTDDESERVRWLHVNIWARHVDGGDDYDHSIDDDQAIRFLSEFYDRLENSSRPDQVYLGIMLFEWALKSEDKPADLLVRAKKILEFYQGYFGVDWSAAAGRLDAIDRILSEHEGSAPLS